MKKARKQEWNEALSAWAREGIPESHQFRQVDAGNAMPVLARCLIHTAEPVIIIFPLLGQAENALAALPLWLRAMEQAGSPPFLVPETMSGSSYLPEQEASRARVIHAASTRSSGIFIASVAGLVSPVPSDIGIAGASLLLQPGMSLSREDFLKYLLDLDYDDEYEAGSPGEFARRGGIIDCFSPAHDYPVRLEFFGDTVESIRLYSPETQRRLYRVDSYTVIPRGSMQDDLPASSSFLDCFGGDPVNLLVVFPDECEEHLLRFGNDNDLKKWRKLIRESHSGRLVKLLDPATSASSGEGAAEECGVYGIAPILEKQLSTELKQSYAEWFRQLTASQIYQWLQRGYRVTLLGAAEASCAHLREWWVQVGFSLEESVIAVGSLPCGILLPEKKAVILTEKEIFAASAHHLRLPPAEKSLKSPAVNRISVTETANLADLEEGDFAVHLFHGICKYLGVEDVEREPGCPEEMLKLEFAGEIFVYIPMSQIHLISRYIGTGKKAPKLSRVGGRAWQQNRNAALRSLRELAADLLRLQAARAQNRGIAYPPDDLEQRVFEEAFPFRDTPDQHRAAEEVKQDMCNVRPMDRLLCGDVGYGKTEIAMRAAFKAVNSGRQVAVLVPTTVLAQQHCYSFRDRFAEYPVIIEMLSRFRSHAEQQKILQALRDKRIDIIIGTHRLIQGDVKFAELGLLVVDEEQRFGVAHKERLKAFRAEVDILTMTATPIPRTLYMAMTGLRDLSTIMTAPGSRLPVQTSVCQVDDALICNAIRQELGRGGQVFFLHNRVKTIEERCRALRRLLPNAHFEIAHGQMPEDELETVMAAFLDGEVDVLVCTTIIESGLDIPNANTIIIERADRFGLAELYQLRGRVGRWTRQAYAYLLLPPHGIIAGTARQRIAAIRRYTELGAGFKLAMRDLEIRGAGNLLGSEQSGHINAIGFELYCQLLRVAVAELQGRDSPLLPEVEIEIEKLSFAYSGSSLQMMAAIPPDYLPSEKLRLAIYRRLALAASTEELRDIRSELEDRCGSAPECVQNLFLYGEMRILCASAGYRCLRIGDGKIILEPQPGRGHQSVRKQIPEKNDLESMVDILSFLRNILRGDFNTSRGHRSF